MGGMVSARTQGAHIPHLSYFHHGGICFSMGSGVRVPDLLSDHWLLCKPPPLLSHPSSVPAPTAARSFTFPGLPCSFTQMLLAYVCPPAVTLPNYHFSLPKSPSYSGIASFLPSLFLVTCLFSLMFLQRSAPRPIHSATQPLSHPLTNPPLLHLWLTALALTKTPACGLTVYFLWMKGWFKVHSCLIFDRKQLIFGEIKSNVCVLYPFYTGE